MAEANDDPAMVLVEEAPSTTSIAAPLPTPAPTEAPTTEASAPVEQSAIDDTAVEDTTVVPPTTDDQPPTAEGGAANASVDATVIAIAEHHVMVAEGDNLWSMTAATLEAHGITNPTCQQVADYWSRVVSANTVESGNPNLIVVGEAITMPAHELPSHERSTHELAPSSQTQSPGTSGSSVDGITVPDRVL